MSTTIYNTEDFHVVVRHDTDPQTPLNSELGFEFHFGIRRRLETTSANCPRPNNPDYWFFPVYGYVHSGVVLSLTPFSCPWDSGLAGYVAVKRPSRGGEWRTRKAFLAYLEACIKTFNDYIAGDCYGYEVVETDTDTVVDSCWGYIGFDHATSGLYEAGKSSCVYFQAEHNKA